MNDNTWIGRLALARQLLQQVQYQSPKIWEDDGDPLSTGPACFDFSIPKRAKEKARREEVGARGPASTLPAWGSTAASGRR